MAGMAAAHTTATQRIIPRFIFINLLFCFACAAGVSIKTF
jgi:hypothetical protein